MPRYYRHLEAMHKKGIERTSSQTLSARTKLTASQIRQDLSAFGEFGLQGYGYSVEGLMGEIADILDRYREGGGFEQSLEYALLGVDSPFEFYLGLRNFIAERDGRSIRKISQHDAYALLYQYIALNYPEKEDTFSRLMHEDYAKKQVRKPPKFKR